MYYISYIVVLTVYIYIYYSTENNQAAVYEGKVATGTLDITMLERVRPKEI